MYFRESTCCGVCISCVPPYVALITSNINSGSYCQLLELLALSLSPTLLIPSSGGRLRSAKLAPSESTPFTLGMDEDSSILTADLSG